MTWFRKHIGQIILHTIIITLLVLMLYPLAMALWNSFKSELAYDYTRWYPTLPLRIRNVSVAATAVWRYTLNTVIVGVVGVGTSLLLVSLASYGFARIKFPGHKFFFSAVLALMMVPGVLTLVPQYMLFRSMGLLDSLMALIIPVAIGGGVFGVFLVTTFFQGLPNDLFEAAKIDGAGDFKCYYKIALPLSMPILGTLAIMQIINVWNDYLWPMITIQDTNKLTISAGLLISFTRQYSANMPITFAGYLVASLPLILLFIFANKYYIEGLVSSAIKL